MAAGDVAITADTMLPNGLRLMCGTVVLDGANATPVTLTNYMASVLWGAATMDGTVAPGADPNYVTSNVSAAVLNVYAWKETTGGAGGNADLVASTNNARVISWIAVGFPPAARV